MYASAVDAFHKLMTGEESECRGFSCRITRMPEIMYLKNGMEYCSLEVTSDNGLQYAIQAYGDEARELYKETLRNKSSSALLEVKIAA